MMDNELIGKETTTTTTTRVSDLPVEVLTEVLVRLSEIDISSACVFVEKSWHSLIKTHMFKTLHSDYQNKIINPKKYLLFWDISNDSYTIRVDDIQCEEYLTLKYPPHLSDCSGFKLVSNGLICVYDYDITMQHLWNPVIQKYITLPDSPLPHDWSWWKAIAFGFVPQINDYIVVLICRCVLSDDEPYTNYIVICVYRLSTNSWKKITLDDIHIDYISHCTSVFVNGVAIWAGMNEQGVRVLVCFDTKTEMLRQILLPEWLERRNDDYWYPFIHAFDQSIAYFDEDNEYGSRSKLGVWVLKGDPMNESVWEMKMTVTLHEDVRARVMGVRNNGEPILCHDYDLISYNLDSPKSFDFLKSWDSWAPSLWVDGKEWRNNNPKEPFVITPFAESLVLLDVDCTQY